MVLAWLHVRRWSAASRPREHQAIRRRIGSCDRAKGDRPENRMRICNCGAEMKATIHRMCFDWTSRASAFAVSQRALARAFPPRTQAAQGGLFFEVAALATMICHWSALIDYLMKEATPQAAFRKSFRRIKGSHPLGELGGNRVRLSLDLKHILERAGRIEPYTRTYAARRPKAAAEPMQWLFNADGQGLLLVFPSCRRSQGRRRPYYGPRLPRCRRLCSDSLLRFPEHLAGANDEHSQPTIRAFPWRCPVGARLPRMRNG